MGKLATKKVKTSKKSGSLGKTVSSLGSIISGSRGGSSARAGGHRRRHHGVAYWQNKVLITKLQKRYMRLKYGGR